MVTSRYHYLQQRAGRVIFRSQCIQLPLVATNVSVDALSEISCITEGDANVKLSLSMP